MNKFAVLLALALFTTAFAAPHDNHKKKTKKPYHGHHHKTTAAPEVPVTITAPIEPSGAPEQPVTEGIPVATDAPVPPSVAPVETNTIPEVVA